jgi:peptidoglycan/xylan/chitin deacetylase (PgdA/CDA1 family)
MRAHTLLFHDVVPDGRWELSGFAGADADVYKLDCVEFHRHLLAMRAKFPHPLAVAADLLKPSAPKSTPVLITFDDGGASALEYIADMLDEFGWKGHFLVTAGRIGTPGFMDRAQIQELHRRGHIIGSHSFTHPTRMSYCSEAQLDDEWGRSVKLLSEILGEPVQVASVPGGFYSRQVAASAAKAGIKLLFNSEPVTGSQTVDGCLVLGRFGLQRGHPPERSAAIVVGDPQLRIREYMFWNSKKLAKTLLGGVWLRIRVMLLERRAKQDSEPGSGS